MINIDRVTQTKAGYPVVELFHYPNNPLAQRLVGIYEYNGHYEVEYWWEDGTYWGVDMPQGMDLIEDEENVTKDKETIQEIINQDFGNQHVNSHMQEALESIIGTASYVLQDEYKEH